MGALVLTGNTSGSVTVAVPAVAGTNTVTIPAATGTVALTSNVIGVSQTWQNLLASRAVNIVYTNSSGKPIQVSIVVNESRVGEYSRARLQVDSIDVAVASSFYSVNGNGNTVTAIVPNGSTYQLIPDEAAYDVLIYWAELR